MLKSVAAAANTDYEDLSGMDDDGAFQPGLLWGVWLYMHRDDSNANLKFICLSSAHSIKIIFG